LRRKETSLFGGKEAQGKKENSWGEKPPGRTGLANTRDYTSFRGTKGRSRYQNGKDVSERVEEVSLREDAQKDLTGESLKKASEILRVAPLDGGGGLRGNPPPLGQKRGGTAERHSWRRFPTV